MNKLVLLSALLVFILATFTDAAIIYSSIDTPLPGSYPSQGYEATSTSELGDYVRFAGTERELTTVEITLTDWACENDFDYISGGWVKNRNDTTACVTTPGSGFTHPITLNIYAVNTSGLYPAAGALIATKTVSAFIPFRPSYDSNSNCTPPISDVPFGGTWYSMADGKCYHGYNFNIIFDMTSLSITLPNDVIFSVAYNTANYGAQPIGKSGPYDSLNYGLSKAALIGTDMEPDTAYLDSTWAGAYCDIGGNGTGVFRRDAGCWTGYVPTALFNANPRLGGTGVGGGIGVELGTEQFKPMIWMCDNRRVLDDNMEPGRVSPGGTQLIERINNYAFEGEQIAWDVLVLDKNGFEKLKDVFVSVGPTQGDGQYIEANCVLDHVLTAQETVDPACNARIDEENITDAFPDSMAYYTCMLTVESPNSMHGQYWVAANVVDQDNQTATFAENEFWFFNPTIMLTFSGIPLRFGTVRPGTIAYSNTITVGNGGEIGSGVMMDMFISGRDFGDPTHSGAKCPSTNQLALSNFRYYAVNGAYSTLNDLRRDSEGYVGIRYGTAFNSPAPFYNSTEVIQAQQVGPYYTANILAPGAEMSVTFKLSLPLPCNGDFSDGNIYFWGEAI